MSIRGKLSLGYKMSVRGKSSPRGKMSVRGKSSLRDKMSQANHLLEAKCQYESNVNKRQIVLEARSQ